MFEDSKGSLCLGGPIYLSCMVQLEGGEQSGNDGGSSSVGLVGYVVSKE